LPSSILPSGQVIITDVRVKSEDILESKNAYKKAMQDLDKTVLFSVSCIERYSFFLPIPRRVEEPAAVIIK
jgi:hypothetical protein